MYTQRCTHSSAKGSRPQNVRPAPLWSEQSRSILWVSKGVLLMGRIRAVLLIVMLPLLAHNRRSDSIREWVPGQWGRGWDSAHVERCMQGLGK